MKKPLRVLLVEDNPSDAELVRVLLGAEDIALEIERVETRQQFEGAMEKGEFDMIISDFSLPTFDGLSALGLARTLRPDLPFLFFSGTIGEEAAVDSLKRGATDYVLKRRFEKLLSAVRRALREVEDRRLREQAEQALARQERWLRAIIENSLDVVAILDVSGRVKYSTPSLEPVLGLLPSEFADHNAFDFVHPADLPPVTKAFLHAIDHPHAPVRFEFRFRHKTGGWRYLEAIGQSLLDDPQIAGVVINCRDMTERRVAQERIRVQAALLDGSDEAIFLTDLNRRILYWNHGAARLYGWESDEVVGHDVCQFCCRENQAQLAEAEMALSTLARWEGELVHLAKNGRQITVSSRWSMQCDEEGKAKSYLVINSDITEKKRTQAQLLRNQRMECIGALAGGIAHDLNNILAPVLMVSELLEREVSSPHALRMLATLNTSAQRGAEMVKQVLSFARGAAGEPAPMGLGALVREVAKLLSETFPPTVRIETKVARGARPVIGQPTQLHQVIMNLCINARDAMAGGGVLRIEVKNALLENRQTVASPEPVSGEFVELSVSDTGCGIPPETIGKVFEPFFTTKEAGRGTGLGLATVLSIVKSHRGFIEIDSTVGVGTTFRIYLPATAAPERPAAPPENQSSRTAQGELVLVVDDEAAILEITRITLEHYNYRVLTASNGLDGLRLFELHREEIQVILTDLMMPIMGGIEMIREMRQMQPGVKVICTTGVGSNANLAEAESLSPNGFLTKPYSAERLVDALITAQRSNPSLTGVVTQGVMDKERP